ncbi:MAG TPA: heme o synthase [Candidatus Binataceae bacterium]|nr:heme o synthase [Candidatus Binataceae bacterium]
MSQPATLASSGLAWASGRPADYLELTKPRVVSMVLVATAAGFYLGGIRAFDYLLALHLMIGTALAAGGTLALNQYFERDLDAMMLRTRMRPLPDGRLTPIEALIFGMVTTVAGLLYLWFTINALATIVTLVIGVLYLGAYTPLKRVSAICTVVGAIPGALPPVAGWAAARGTLSVEPLALFAIMYLWQLPHTLAIAELYRTDYARAGIRLLPIDDPRATGRQVVSNSLALLAVGMLPTILGFAGLTYFLVALTAGAIMLVYGVKLAAAPGPAAARRLLFASLVYLPIVLLVLVLDKVRV